MYAVEKFTIFKFYVIFIAADNADSVQLYRLSLTKFTFKMHRKFHRNFTTLKKIKWHSK